MKSISHRLLKVRRCLRIFHGLSTLSLCLEFITLFLYEGSVSSWPGVKGSTIVYYTTEWQFDCVRFKESPSARRYPSWRSLSRISQVLGSLLFLLSSLHEGAWRRKVIGRPMPTLSSPDFLEEDPKLVGGHRPEVDEDTYAPDPSFTMAGSTKSRIGSLHHKGDRSPTPSEASALPQHKPPFTPPVDGTEKTRSKAPTKRQSGKIVALY